MFRIRPVHTALIHMQQEENHRSMLRVQLTILHCTLFMGIATIIPKQFLSTKKQLSHKNIIIIIIINNTTNNNYGTFNEGY